MDDGATRLRKVRRMNRARDPADVPNHTAEPETLLDAIRQLTRQNRRDRDGAIEQRLVRLRHEAFVELDRSPQLEVWPPLFEEMFPGNRGLPEVTRAELTLEALRAGVLGHGSLIVRGLLGSRDVDLLARDIEVAFTAHDTHEAHDNRRDTAPWYVPFEPSPGSPQIPHGWLRERGVLLAADSPRVLFDIIECLDATPIPALIEAYLGERPALSVKKLTCRRISDREIAARGDHLVDWHQDGSFIGTGVRSVNVWIALSTCGIDAPSLDVVARRLDHIAETGTRGAAHDWTVGPAVVQQAANGAAIAHPCFEPGDAMIFDEMCLHGTGIRPGMTQYRYAIEAWFFAPSTYPLAQIPLVY